MTEMTSYEPGVPNWVDLGSPDLHKSIGFYSGLFGWEVPEQENSAQYGGYRRAELDGKAIAGMMPLMDEGQPPVWSSYVAVADADQTTAKVQEAGGSVVAEPMDVADLGRMAVFTDPEGVYFGIWQAGSFPGAERVNDPNTFAWSELNTRNPDGAKEFYGAVFGWTANEVDMGEGGTYVTWRHPSRSEDEDSVGGMLDMRGRVPDEVPPHWLVYFTVDNRDASLEMAKASGGTEMLKMDMEMGRLAIISDPHGSAFGIFQQLQS
jgi:predicted enzyme related to lactoylglutathione lyase